MRCGNWVLAIADGAEASLEETAMAAIVKEHLVTVKINPNMDQGRLHESGFRVLATTNSFHNEVLNKA